MRGKIGLGIEIECILNSSIHSIQEGSYHNGIKIRGLTGFKAERDGSLRGIEFEENSHPIEIISNCYGSVASFKSAIERFIKFFSKDGHYELKDVLRFNRSCGSHLHISIKDLVITNKVILQVFQNTRKYFIGKVKQSNIESKQDILDRYNRSYAQLMTKENFRRVLRNKEFNLAGEGQGTGIEWRSLNLTNIKTWDELREIIAIIINSVEYFIKNAQKFTRRGWVEIKEKPIEEQIINEKIEIRRIL